MTISLLIPCYNASDYLPRLIATVREQTSPFTEIICYDDGSIDDTVQIARDLGLKILVGGKNRGPAYARNRLAEAAQCPWIHFHDADDLLEAEFVEKMSHTLSLNPSADVAVCQMDWLIDSSRELYRAWRYNSEKLAKDALAECISNPISTIACVYRRKQLLDINGFNEDFRSWEDGDFHVRLAANGASFTVIDEVLSIALRHRSGASADHVLLDSNRTLLLEHYANLYPNCQAVACEAEKLAVRLHNEDPHDQRLDRLLHICRRYDREIPTTNHPLWKLVRSVLPSKWVLSLRSLARKRRL